ncbi:hypothetical protein ACFSCW_05010 [Sphingomonas tabacisoli]|uniref:Uncharacterized protein n=1 Tax=Sphingomonas tabacisoli TaxID=2249466 RepID=A0ABW4I0C6_9SPHN
MSPSNSVLRIRSDDPTAQIKVLDASANIVAQGLRSLEAPLANGLYKIRVRVGSSSQERLVALDDQLPEQTFPRLEFASPIPIDGTERSHEYHQDAIKWAWDHPAPARGAGSRLLVCAREWSPGGTRGHPNPAASLSIVLPSGERIPFASVAHVRSQGDAIAVGVFDVNPGFYSIEVELPDGSRLRRAMHASPGWATQLYMLFHGVGDQRVPNLADGSAVIAKSPVVHDEETRLAEIALDALTQHRAILSDQMRGLLSGKFSQPLLGLVGAHLLLRDGVSDLVHKVVKNLVRMLGADHPDVVAIKTKVDKTVPGAVTEPPMLRASWDFLVEASGTVPQLIPPTTPAGQMAESVVPAGAWLVWQPAGQGGSKLEVLRAYLRAQSRDSFASDDASPSFDAAPADLGEAARADLAIALGLPRPALDGLLARL